LLWSEYTFKEYYHLPQ